MDYPRFLRKISFLTAVLFIFSCSSLFAATAESDRQFLSHKSLLDSDFSALTIDHSSLYAEKTTSEASQYRLYAMATGSGSAADESVPSQKSESSLEKWHKYLGYGTVLMAGVTAVTNSEEETHEAAAYVTAAGALSTLLTGYLAHGQRFDLDQGLLTKDNIHIALGTLGAVILTTAVAIADDGRESSHSGMGVTGGVLMAIGVIDIKW